MPFDPAVPLTRGHSLIPSWQTDLVTSFMTGPEGAPGASAHISCPSVALRTLPQAAVGQRDVEWPWAESEFGLPADHQIQGQE